MKKTAISRLWRIETLAFAARRLNPNTNVQRYISSNFIFNNLTCHFSSSVHDNSIQILSAAFIFSYSIHSHVSGDAHVQLLRCSSITSMNKHRIASGELNTAVINSITASMPPWASSSLMVSRSDSADRKDTNVAEAKTFRPNTSLSQTNRCADWEQAVNAPHCSRPERTNVVDEMGTQS
ncbi:hypothetical protein T09_6338 [Trichinella sp. T9]|nr:hypothetical protein T09_6338 [Trichinella sp. T9]